MKRISPEEAGVSSRSLCGFFEALDALPFDMHSVIMIRHGRVLLETYYEPFDSDTLHRMFSVTKSFVSLAIGHLAYEGKISLDAPITDYFPEYPTDNEYLKKTTIRNMLMMRTPHEKTTYKADLTKNWVESYFTTEPTHDAGTVFSYDTSASHTLASLVEKVTGMELLDYLRCAFLDEIGFSKSAYCLKDPFGVSVGGSGLMATPMDLARTALFVMNGGRYEGRVLTDSVYLEEATSFLTRTDTRGGFADEKQGYGMQFWRTRNNGFMFYGIGGQIALCLPDKDFIMVTTADTLGYQGGVQSILNIFWREVYSRLDEPCCCGDYTLKKLLECRKVMPVRGSKNTFDGEYAFDENAMGLERLHIVSNEDGGRVEYTNKTGSHVLEFKTDGFHTGKFPHYGCKCITSGAWDGENILIVKSRLIGEMVGAVTMEMYISEDGVTVSSRKTEGTFFAEFNGIAQGRKM